MSEQLGTIHKDLADILKVNRVRAYEIAKRLPPGVLVKIGTRQLRVNLPALREWISAGGTLSESEGQPKKGSGLATVVK
jgi:hypothetical protein